MEALVMSEANPMRRHSRRAEIKQVDDVVPVQPLEPADELVHDEFELKIAWLVRLLARGQVAHQLANSLNHLAKSLAICMILLSIAFSLNLVFTNWSAWSISISKHFPFSFQRAKE
jgi:hypothetical protein